MDWVAATALTCVMVLAITAVLSVVAPHIVTWLYDLPKWINPSVGRALEEKRYDRMSRLTRLERLNESIVLIASFPIELFREFKGQRAGRDKGAPRPTIQIALSRPRFRRRGRRGATAEHPPRTGTATLTRRGHKSPAARQETDGLREALRLRNQATGRAMLEANERSLQRISGGPVFRAMQESAVRNQKLLQTLAESSGVRAMLDANRRALPDISSNSLAFRAIQQVPLEGIKGPGDLAGAHTVQALQSWNAERQRTFPQDAQE